MIITAATMPRKQCQLVGGLFCSLIQLILFCCSFSSLLFKRKLERPKR